MHFGSITTIYLFITCITVWAVQAADEHLTSFDDVFEIQPTSPYLLPSSQMQEGETSTSQAERSGVASSQSLHQLAKARAEVLRRAERFLDQGGQLRYIRDTAVAFEQGLFASALREADHQLRLEASDAYSKAALRQRYLKIVHESNYVPRSRQGQGYETPEGSRRTKPGNIRRGSSRFPPPEI